jgi:hypothetical protein
MRSPFWYMATMASSITLASGTLRERCGESAPSAMIHFAFGSTPASSSNVHSGTPVHSAHELRPCSTCKSAWIGSLENNGALLPPHSVKPTRVTSE